ncbi:MAG: hypothetical protein PHF86_08970 [Candidatus Nanoarchaeia archaeon]|nr:hypothetical protein [Candidatus Nanoarchaeia archaeon]
MTKAKTAVKNIENILLLSEELKPNLLVLLKELGEKSIKKAIFERNSHNKNLKKYRYYLRREGVLRENINIIPGSLSLDAYEEPSSKYPISYELFMNELNMIEMIQLGKNLNEIYDSTNKK